MCSAKLCRAMWGVQNGGSAAVPASTVAVRSDAARNTASHECAPNGMPSSDSHSHNGSRPAGPSVNSSSRSSGSRADLGLTCASPQIPPVQHRVLPPGLL